MKKIAYPLFLTMIARRIPISLLVIPTIVVHLFLVPSLDAANKEISSTNLFESRVTNDNYDVYFREVNRTSNTSTIHYYENKGKSIGSIMFFACSASKLAKIRGFRYFVALEKQMTEKEYSSIVIGFLNENTQGSFEKQFGSNYRDHKDKIQDTQIYDSKCKKEGL